MRRLLRISPPNQPLPNLVRRRLHPRTVGFCPRHARLHRLQHFLGEHFARIIRIRSLPVRVRHDDHHRRACRQKRTQQRDQRSRRKRFPLRQARRIQNFYAGCFLGFLHLGEFELLRQCFVHGFLYLHAPEQVGVSNSEKRKPADRRISCILYCSRWPRLPCGSSTEFVELPAQFPEACLHGAAEVDSSATSWLSSSTYGWAMPPARLGSRSVTEMVMIPLLRSSEISVFSSSLARASSSSRIAYT